MTRTLVTLATGLLLSGVANSAIAQTVTGTAMYRERMALPAGAVLEATLEDVSRADAQADVIGTTRIDSPGNPPYKFTITYDPAKINQSHRYSVRATITLKDELVFTSDQAYPVLTGGHPNNVSIVLKKVAAKPVAKPVAGSGPASKPPAQGTAKPAAGATKASGQGAVKPPPLVGTHWTLTHLGDTAVTPAGGDGEAHLLFASEGSRVTGSTGCNRLTGTYTQKAEALTFGPAATTRMACLPAVSEIESKMLAALQATATGKITGSELALSDKSGQVVARFTAR